MTHLRAEVLQAKFSDLCFDEGKHLYTVDGIIYPSVSSFVESHAPKFNAEAILPYSAAKQNKSIQELRQEWDDKRDLRCRIGHTTHSFLERYNGLQLPSTGWEEAGVKFFKEFSKEYDILFRELRMYSREYRYAGTEDLILVHRSTGSIITADWKTNEDLWKSYRSQMLLPPFDWMECHPYNKYQLQLSYYQIMLEEASMNVADRWLLYLKEDGNYELHQLVDFTEELRDHLRTKKAA
jgi:hypothetical protein